VTSYVTSITACDPQSCDTGHKCNRCQSSFPDQLAFFTSYSIHCSKDKKLLYRRDLLEWLMVWVIYQTWKDWKGYTCAF